MTLAAYAGAAQNDTHIMEAVVGETIKAAFVDAKGRIWLISPSGHAVTFAGFDRTAPSWSIEPPHVVQHAVETRRQEIRHEIDQLRRLVPGIEV
jgi:hypothetical protein